MMNKKYYYGVFTDFEYNGIVGDNMKSILVALVCKQCMYKTHKKSETLVMPDFEPDVREALLDGSFFKKRCPCCGAVIEFIHQVLYVDKKHKFILLIKPRDRFKCNDHEVFQQHVDFRRRYVHSIHEIAEKLRILEDALDDRVIELLKAKLLLRAIRRQQQMHTICYHDIDKQSKTIWFHVEEEGKPDLIAVMEASYEQLAKTLPLERRQSFEEINLTWGINYLKS